ncbi:hypothetical protein C2E31_10915 [Rhodopirellula baltica]|nr:hypothetical protein C2E31_10915 [Rhodopirellula baltica]
MGWPISTSWIDRHWLDAPALLLQLCRISVSLTDRLSIKTSSFLSFIARIFLGMERSPLSLVLSGWPLFGLVGIWTSDRCHRRFTDSDPGLSDDREGRACWLSGLS